MAEIKRSAESSANERPIELRLPINNESIPSRLDGGRKEVAEPLKAPKLIRNDDSARTWYKKDDRFWVPKANLRVTLRNPLASLTLQTTVVTHLYRELVQDALAEYSSNAEISGLDYSFINHSLGLDMNVSGYNDKISVLLERVLVSMRDLEV